MTEENECLPIFCECGGVMSSKMGSKYVICLDCKSEYRLQRVQENE